MTSLNKKQECTDPHIAQVEVLLKDAAGKLESTGLEKSDQRAWQDQSGNQGNVQGDSNPLERPAFPTLGNGVNGNFSWASGADTNDTTTAAGVPFELPYMQQQSRSANAGVTSNELLSLGLFEALPPSELIEEL